MTASCPDTRLAKSQIDELRSLIPERARRSGPVSAWSVGQHLEHCVLSMRSMLGNLLACTGPAPEASPAPAGLRVLAAGKIPRGAAEAPEVARPKVDAAPDELEIGLAECSSLLLRAPEIREDAWSRHFALGILRRDQAMRFLEIHTDHHLGIIRDILRA